LARRGGWSSELGAEAVVGSPVSSVGGSSRLFDGRKLSRKRTSSSAGLVVGLTNCGTPDLLVWLMGAAELLLRDVLAGDLFTTSGPVMNM
jgi:hypothetical protein